MQQSSQIRNPAANGLPSTYFDLIVLVGSEGKYQMRMMLIFLVNWFVTGVILMSTAFLFLNKEFDCQAKGLFVEDCPQYVCALPSSMWQGFIGQGDSNDFQSLATDFRYYLCDEAYVLDLASSCTYFGAFIGYILISFFSDNFGRRTSMLLAWATTTIGSIIVACSINIWMAAAGLFLSGAGADASINICFFFFGEVVGDKKRQQYSVIVQILFTLGAMLVTVLFYFIVSWRWVWIISVTGPSILALIALFFYVKETPQFLIRKGVAYALKHLNQIGKINKGSKEILEEQHIEAVMQNQVVTTEFSGIITPIDLIRFPSLRTITIACSLISFMTYGMYYGPTLIISSIGFNIYISSLMVQLSELVMFLPAYFTIERIERKRFGILLILIATSMAIILIFVEKPADCQLCLQSIIQLVLIFIFRFCVSFFFCFFQVYTCELYPSRARGLGSGIVSAIGTLASTSAPILLGMLQRNDINVMSFFVLFGIISIGSLTMLQQTKGKVLKQEIEQIQMEKDKRRSKIGTSSLLSKEKTSKSLKSQ